MDLLKIPQDLKDLNNFFCYKKVGGKKTNFNPKTGKEIADYSRLFSFSDCVSSVELGHYEGIGFFIKEDDNFTVVSLNGQKGTLESTSKFLEIIEKISSYTEISASEFDFKIWILGKPFDRNGKLRDNIFNKDIEIFTQNCFVYLTGNTLNGLDINPSTTYLNQLYNEITSETATATKLINVEPQEEFTDTEIIKRIKNSSDSENFLSYKNGMIGDCFSKVDAENNLIEIISKHTQNYLQIARIVAETRLYDDSNPPIYYEEKILKVLKNGVQKIAKVDPKEIKTPKLKSNKEIVVDMLVKEKGIRQQQINKINSEAEYIENRMKFDEGQKMTYPPGRMRDLIDGFLEQSVLPVREISTIGAIGMISAIAGRQFQFSGSGLGQYLLLIAKTGRGKNEIERGFSNFFSAIYPKCENIWQFKGPANIASGQALARYISENPCFGSIVGEFFTMIKRLSMSNASQADQNLLLQLLDLYSKSGQGQRLEKMVYADKKNNTNVVEAPSLTIVGETSPQVFYESLNENMISNGLLNRFSIFQYFGERVAESDTFYNFKASPALVDHLAFLANKCISMQRKNKFQVVESTGDATEFFKISAEKIRSKINIDERDAITDLWGRIALKTRRLAGVLAVIDNPDTPKITLDMARWSYDIQYKATEELVEKFKNGEIGNSDDGRQLQEIEKSLVKFLDMDDYLRGFHHNEILRTEKIVGYSFFTQTAGTKQCFKNSKGNLNFIMRNCLKHFVDCGDLRQCTESEIKKLLGSTRSNGLYFKILNVKKYSK